MPTYEYKCDACGKKFDLFQRMSDSPIEECKFCGGKVKRLIGTGAGIIFKGSGWYVTDFKNSGSEKSSTKKSEEAIPASTPEQTKKSTDSSPIQKENSQK